jgi:hypothetical protein
MRKVRHQITFHSVTDNDSDAYSWFFLTSQHVMMCVQIIYWRDLEGELIRYFSLLEETQTQSSWPVSIPAISYLGPPAISYLGRTNNDSNTRKHNEWYSFNDENWKASKYFNFQNNSSSLQLYSVEILTSERWPDHGRPWLKQVETFNFR